MTNILLRRFQKAQQLSWHQYHLQWYARKHCCSTYAWAVPTQEAISLIASYSPIVELGAGGGYWAKLLVEAGADVVAYDKRPPGIRRRYQSNRKGNYWCWRRHFNVRRGGPSRLKKHADRTLFLCWPPYDEPLAYDALRLYRGDRVIYIGESSGGCTGCDKFHALLHREWVETEQLDIPQWQGLHDYLTVYVRRKQNGEYASL